MRPEFKQISDTIWEIDKNFKPGMQVPVRVIATKKLLDGMEDSVFDQITNVATLQGIVRHAICLPDAHTGYGAPIGCIFATDPEADGVISPGAVGFDINCGVRLIRSDLTVKDVEPRLEELVRELFKRIPTGVGAKGFWKLSKSEFPKMMIEGARFAIDQGYGWEEDKDSIEENGAIAGADPQTVSQRAVERGFNQLGTLGSGNHYLEIQKTVEVFNEDLAKAFGIFKEQIVIMIHCGSRGFGHQVGTDYIRLFNQVMEKYKITVSDRQLAAAPFNSKDGKAYFSAMAAAANNAFANRQVITHRVREVCAKAFGRQAKDLGLHLVYDVAHNMAKLERYKLNEQEKTLVIHRKGATRSFGPGRTELTKKYQETGQPVIIGGSMETGSYLLVGTREAADISFSSTAHGSGRSMSRAQAKREVHGQKLQEEMREKGILVMAQSLVGLAEEAGIAYKDVSEVVDATVEAGISKKVARFVPIGNIKG